EDFADVSTRSNGCRLAIRLLYMIPYPLFDFVPDHRGIAVLENADGSDFERACLYFFSVCVNVQFGASSAHVDMQVSFVLEPGNDGAVDEFGFAVAVDNLDIDAKFLFHHRGQLCPVFRLAHGGGSAEHVIIDLI